MKAHMMNSMHELPKPEYLYSTRVQDEHTADEIEGRDGASYCKCDMVDENKQIGLRLPVDFLQIKAGQAKFRVREVRPKQKEKVEQVRKGTAFTLLLSHISD